jgi:uncharacterized protein (TIGR02599 family)
LIEMLVSVVVLLFIMAVVLSITSQTGKIWQSTTAKIGAFEEARIAFESMTRTISQATLNTYYDYDNSAAPTTYIRQSQLHFICGPASSLVPSTLKNWSGQAATAATRPTHAIFFQAPTGYDASTANINLIHLLNAVGYYIEFNSDAPAHPNFISAFTPRYRYRLMTLSQSSNNLLVYDSAFLVLTGWPTYNGWFNDSTNGPIAQGEVRPLATNIIALILQPKLSASDTVAVTDSTTGTSTTITTLAPEYCYDSRTASTAVSGLYTSLTPSTTSNLHSNQLPPLVQVTMVAIDEPSAILLAQQNGANPPALVSSTAFRDATKFSSGDSNNPLDLETLEASLSQKHLKYKVFSTTVSIRGAKWSND